MAQSSTVTLKLFIDTHGEKVLFAEAGKDFVDFLFHIFSLSVGTVISLLRNQKMADSLANLYESIENLNESYIQPKQTKDSFLKPVDKVSGSLLLLAPLNSAPTVQKKIYMCSQCISSNASDEPRVVCPICLKIITTNMLCVAPSAVQQASGGAPIVQKFYMCSQCISYYVSDEAISELCPIGRRYMTSNMSYVTPAAVQQASGSEGGFVKGMVTYMVMDDLVVMPLSTVSIIALLNKFNVKEVSALEEIKGGTFGHK